MCVYECVCECVIEVIDYKMMCVWLRISVLSTFITVKGHPYIPDQTIVNNYIISKQDWLIATTT